MALCKRGEVWHYDFWYHGRRHRGSTGEKLRSRAEKVQAILIHEANEKRSLLARTKIPRLAEFSQRFLEWVDASQLEPNTKRYYQYGWEMLQETAVAHLKLDEITRDSTEPLKFSGSPAKADGALGRLRRMLSKAVEWGYMRQVARIPLRKEQGREVLISLEAETKLLAVAKQPLRDVILLMQDTGMRPQDVFRMRWENIN